MQTESIRKYALKEAVGNVVDVLDCDNGKFRFLINVNKTCDIMQLYHEGQNVLFVSKNGFSSKTEEFISRFEGGMLYTCGLENIGGRAGYDGICKVNIWTAMERDSSPVLFYEMVKNAEKVAGEKTVEKLIEEGYLTEKCRTDEKINIGYFTEKYRNTIVFNKMKDMVNDYLNLWYL